MWRLLHILAQCAAQCNTENVIKLTIIIFNKEHILVVDVETHMIELLSMKLRNQEISHFENKILHTHTHTHRMSRLVGRLRSLPHIINL